jgi:putative ABC transport system substrate-binding protein
MRRREFVKIAGGAFMAWPAAARGQQPGKIYRIGYLALLPGEDRTLMKPLLSRLDELGYTEGRNLTVKYRSAEGHPEQLPQLAAELVGSRPEVLIAGFGTLAAKAAKAATTTISIVFTTAGDPVGAGLVANLARPGGNLTGFSFLFVELHPKRLELLSELIPRARVIALLVNPNFSSGADRIIQDVQGAARAKGIRLHILKAGTEAEIDAAFATLAQQHAGALLVGSAPLFDSRREQIVALASRHAVPAIYPWRTFVVSGGLISYGTSLTDVYRQVGMYAGKILKGAKPADLPVQQPTRFELVINLKTAKPLGLAVPQSLLARADEVIE